MYQALERFAVHSSVPFVSVYLFVRCPYEHLAVRHRDRHHPRRRLCRLRNFHQEHPEEHPGSGSDARGRAPQAWRGASGRHEERRGERAQLDGLRLGGDHRARAGVHPDFSRGRCREVLQCAREPQ